MESQSIREAITDAIGYWEPRRILYNIALAGVVLIHFFANYPASRDKLQAELFLSLFVLAVLANVAYCAAYLGDIFAQFSGYRDVWKKFRWILFAIGVAFAGTIAHFMTMGFFLVH